MRGEILQYANGVGLISGDDGARYSFTEAQVAEGAALRVGMRVDFVVADGQAGEIYPMPGSTPEPVETTGEDLGVWEYFKKCMRLYAEGDGRARRKEYWSFVLFSWIFAFVFFLVLVMPVATIVDDGANPDLATAIILLAVAAFFIGFLAPSYAVLSRRLHDVGMSGWFALLSLVPYLGGLFVLVVALIPSQMAKNRYGPYPKPLPPT